MTERTETGTPQRIEKRYPLPDAEAKALRQQMLASEVAMLALGTLLSAVLAFSRRHDLFAAVLEMGWLADIAGSFKMGPELVVLPAAFMAAQLALSKLELHNAAFERAEAEVRQGLMGEMIRLPLSFTAPLMLLVGFAEELCFRFGIQGVTCDIASGFLAPPGALCIAVVGTTALFTFTHVQYRHPINISTVACVGFVFGVTFAATQNLLAIALAHALYDLIGIIVERRACLRDADYFKGKMPERIVCDMLAKKREQAPMQRHR